MKADVAPNQDVRANEPFVGVGALMVVTGGKYESTYFLQTPHRTVSLALAGGRSFLF